MPSQQKKNGQANVISLILLPAFEPTSIKHLPSTMTSPKDKRAGTRKTTQAHPGPNSSVHLRDLNRKNRAKPLNLRAVKSRNNSSQFEVCHP